MSDRADKLRPAMDALRLPDVFGPDVGILIFVFDRGEGGEMNYICNCDREDACTTLLEWIGTQKPDLLQKAFTRIFAQSLYGKERT